MDKEFEYQIIQNNRFVRYAYEIARNETFAYAKLQRRLNPGEIAICVNFRFVG